jgi:hypothetical protein
MKVIRKCCRLRSMVLLNSYWQVDLKIFVRF